jgi:Flp pilus assembly protein TadG
MSVFKLRVIGRYQGLARRFRRDQDGVAAVEFALVCVPFFMMLFGIMGASFWFFKTFLVEKAVWDVSRDMRTGAFQTGTGDYAALDIYVDATATPKVLSPDKLQVAFKRFACTKAMLSDADCAADMRILAQSGTTFAGMTQPACLAGGNLKTEAVAKSEFVPGGASMAMLVTACYQWKFASSLPFLKFGNMSNGARLLQGSAGFRVEPFN